ncbi:MAG: carboxypeptidase regulatory-like domain-containing protein [Bacteroidia bacterium]
MQIRTLLLTFWAGIFLNGSVAYAQSLTQTVRGKIVDQESQFPLAGVTAILIPADGAVVIGAYSNENGEFRLNNVPLGRQNFSFRYTGYEQVVLNNIEVTSAKEVILQVLMAPSAVTTDTVSIVGRRNGDVSNEFAPVSARQFSVIESNLYAGSRGSPPAWPPTMLASREQMTAEMTSSSEVIPQTVCSGDSMESIFPTPTTSLFPVRVAGL